MSIKRYSCRYVSYILVKRRQNGNFKRNIDTELGLNAMNTVYLAR